MMTHCHRCGQHWDLILSMLGSGLSVVLRIFFLKIIQRFFFGADNEVIS